MFTIPVFLLTAIPGDIEFTSLKNTKYWLYSIQVENVWNGYLFFIIVYASSNVKLSPSHYFVFLFLTATKAASVKFKLSVLI